MTENVRMRIGDADREAAIAALGDHYAAGRLTKDEYDERADGVWEATVRADLTPLFADLPGGAATRASATTPPVRTPASARSGSTPRFMPMFPVLALVAVVVLAIAAGAPWLLFGLFFLGMCGGGHRRARMSHRWQGS